MGTVPRLPTPVPGLVIVEFIPETQTVINDLIRHGEPGVGEVLLDLAARARAIVPDLVGVSVGQTRLGVVFTLAATSVQAASVDAAQYLDGGPCVDASTLGTAEAWRGRSSPADVMDEDRWATYTRATAAEGVASSLSLPLTIDGETVGGVNLYASTPDAFDGHHDALARALGADVHSMVANADLSFTTREDARQTVHRLADKDLVNQAMGILAARHDLDIGVARERLASTARRAGITEIQAAHVVINSLGSESRR